MSRAEDAYQQALAVLVAAGILPDGACLEMSCLMQEFLGRGARLVRYENDQLGGHWTVTFGGVEYDGTIAFWDGGPGGLVVVTDESPHRGWWRDPKPKPEVAREIAQELLGEYWPFRNPG